MCFLKKLSRLTIKVKINRVIIESFFGVIDKANLIKKRQEKKIDSTSGRIDL